MHEGNPNTAAQVIVHTGFIFEGLFVFSCSLKLNSDWFPGVNIGPFRTISISF